MVKKLVIYVKYKNTNIINKPNIKQTETNKIIFLDLVNPEPTCSPIGVIAISAPKLNKPIPKIKRTADTANTIISLVEKSTNGVKFKMITIKVTGKTETNASLILTKSCLFILSPP